ncbi:glyoxal oxidase [Botryosphaeria dothidea]|uniref:Glyoxal oxidase n=1 Tax=Botryosphaeria dothidea TaxID=55169 RepID=A0A8H4IWB6_9PEZI|nr:glyoxal oxidase [Botryosphaeria dothidea]
MNLIHSFVTALFLLQAATVLADSNVTDSANATNMTRPTGPVTTDSRCGPDHNNTICVLDGIAPCCSFCGGDKRYCSTGCQPLYGLCTAPNSTTLNNPACSWARQGDSPRCDGQCGADHAGALCDASAQPDDFAALGVFGYGPCCSKEGFCGNTSDHCEITSGCQSGCWGGGDDEAAPSSSGSARVSTVTVTASAAASSTGAAGVVRGASEGALAVGLSVLGMLVGI